MVGMDFARLQYVDRSLDPYHHSDHRVGEFLTRYIWRTSNPLLDVTLELMFAASFISGFFRQQVCTKGKVTLVENVKKYVFK